MLALHFSSDGHNLNSLFRQGLPPAQSFVGQDGGLHCVQDPPSIILQAPLCLLQPSLQRRRCLVLLKVHLQGGTI